MENSIHQSTTIYKYFKKLNLCRVFSHTVIKHILSILISVFSMGYHGKTVDFEKYSSCHRTTIAHFLNNGKWNDCKLQGVMKSAVIDVIYGEAVRSGKPILCIVDDTISSGSRQYYVYRYEGKLNGTDNAIVLISYPKNAFHNPKALRTFICTDVSLSTREILDRYIERWPIEVFFRQSKSRLAFSHYQIRSSQGIRRYWLLMSPAHFICYTCLKDNTSFEAGYSFLQKELVRERITYFYQCGANHIPLENVFALVG